MNTKSGDLLKISAETGDIGLLYTVIQDDPSILENIDKNQFVETPLHISVPRGHIEFSTEIMNLKPSLAMKLNMQGYSPIHLAMDNRLIHLATDNRPIHLAMDKRQREMVYKLVGINEDLVRVKGREGLTPLHFAIKKGDFELLDEFLAACPDSMEDVNVRGESALHIAVKYGQLEAFEVLVGWLKANSRRGARKLGVKILNLKDKDGNTVLHISALSSDPKFLQFLVKSRIKLNTTNLEKRTALDLAIPPEIKKILIHAKAKHGSEVRKTQTFAEILRSKTMIMDTIATWVHRIRGDIAEEQRNTWAVVATLVATVTYESALNPPGGVFQVSASDDDNMKITSKDSYYSTRGNAGKSILSREKFMVFSLANMLSFSTSILAICILSPSGEVGALVLAPMGLFVTCYLIAMPAISPTHANTTILDIPAYFICFALFFGLLLMYFEYKRVKKLSRSLSS